MRKALKDSLHIKKEEEDGVSPNAVRHNGIDNARCLLLLQVIIHERLLQCARYEAIFGVCNGLFAILVQHSFQSLCFAIARGDNRFSVR